MQLDGAAIIDIGAESTRPGSVAISAAEELRRLLPVLEALRGKLKIPISVDTQKSAVAELALGAGAEIVNDISGLRSDPALAGVAAKYGTPLILMHMRGTPRSMQKGPFARDAMRDVMSGLRKSIATAKAFGVKRSQIVIDQASASARAIRKITNCLPNSRSSPNFGYPLMVGTSRKGFLGATLGKERKAGAGRGTYLCDRRNRGGEHFERRTHRTCARRRGNEASRAGCGLCASAGPPRENGRS